MKSFQNSGKKHLVITGKLRSGKTSRLLEIVKLFTNQEELPGISTYAIPYQYAMLRENGTDTERRIGEFTDRMYPIQEGFRELGVPALERAIESEAEWASIDELGFLEANCEPFKNVVIKLFNSKRVLAILRKQAIPFLEEIKQREDVFVVDIEEETARIGCIIMASGVSRRFGSNKLLQEVEGKTLIDRVLELTEGDLFTKRVVVTRTEEVATICKEKNIPVILHSYPNRNEAVKLGIESLKEMDGWVFCPCDQPLLKRESLENLLATPYIHDDLIARLHWEDSLGTPIFFGKKYYEELCNLPEKKGGSYVAKQHPEKVTLVSVLDEKELWDLDTPEDLRRFSFIK
jgi:molybdenum cofactor cytidylyltransferase